MYQKVALTVELIIKFLDASYKDKPDFKIDDYELVSIPENGDFKELYDTIKSKQKYLESDATQFVKVYYSKKRNHCVVVHRGTYDAFDLPNAECAMELCPVFKTCSPPGIKKCKYKDTRRFKVSEMIQKWAEEKYSQRNVTTLGHSQGGLLAALVGQNSKEIIKIQPLHRETYKDTDKEITIRSVNDLIDKRNVIKDKIVESNPSTHMYVHINNPTEKGLFHEKKKDRYGLDDTEHNYQYLFAEFDKQMKIGKDVFNEDQCMVPSNIEQYKGLLQDAKSEQIDTPSYKSDTPEKSDNLITLIKYIGTGAVIMGSMYVGYKWLNNRTSKKKGCRSASRKVSKVRSRRKLSSKMSRH